MKKNIFKIAFIGGMMFASPVFATECANGAGTQFQGTVSGTFCISKMELNWWSAFSWCRAAGGQLASWDQACPGVQPPKYPQRPACSNLSGNTLFVWTATPYGKAFAYGIDGENSADLGNAYRLDRKGGYGTHALCLMP